MKETPRRRKKGHVIVKRNIHESAGKEGGGEGVGLSPHGYTTFYSRLLDRNLRTT
jgi:hypothetical protein